MIDIKFLRENPEIVRENIRKKFQEHKLPLVDEAIELDSAFRAAIKEADELRASRNKISKQIGALMAQGKKDEAEEAKKQVAANAARLAELEEIERELEEKLISLAEKVLSNYELRIFKMYAHGARAKEISAKIGKDEKSVNNAIFRIRSKLKKQSNIDT